jgi:cellulose synthase/poly-beta-1,6-N-acetylglucosamine synthase-like glycosyltransferase
VGFTIAFGATAVAWADQHFAYWVAAGPRTIRAATQRWTAVLYELALWMRCIVAAGITIALLVALIALVDNAATTEALYEWFRIAVGSVIFWFIFGPVWTLLFFRRGVRDA